MSEGLWIAIAVIAVLLVVALVVGLVRYRRRRIRLSAADTATPVDRSGGYTATSGISFTQATAPVGAPPKAPERPERLDTSGLPAVGDDATIPRDAPKRPIADVTLPEPPVVTPEPPVVTAEPPVAAPEPPTVAAEPVVDTPEPVTEVPEPVAPDLDAIAPIEGRLDRLRGRLAKSQNTLGRSMLGLLGGGDLDEDSWEEVEDTLLIADLGPV
ncbi:signal recognition particle-docking protein FtsY, partial [Mycobacterium sp. ITM-2017-0098]